MQSSGNGGAFPNDDPITFSRHASFAKTKSHSSPEWLFCFRNRPAAIAAKSHAASFRFFGGITTPSPSSTVTSF